MLSLLAVNTVALFLTVPEGLEDAGGPFRSLAGLASLNGSGRVMSEEAFCLGVMSV